MRHVLSLFRFGVDLDGVLNNLSADILRELVSRGIIPSGTTADQVTEYDFANFPGVTREVLEPLFLNGTIMREAKPDYDARAFLSKLRDAGAEIHIVTARGLSPQHRRDTQDWLREYYIPYDRLAFVGKHFKDTYAEEHKLDFFLEDHYPTALSLTEVCRASILLDKPYNQALVLDCAPNLFRAHTWTELIEFFFGRMNG